MKKLPIALIVATLALSGCGLFGTKHAWKQAEQENPLQIPPGMDRPATTAALTIPPPGNTQAASTTAQAPAQAVAPRASNATTMHLSDDVDTAYKRIGLALQNGDLGTVTAQDATQHTYQLSVSSKPVISSSPSFLQKHFSNLNKQQGAGSNGASTSARGGEGAVVVTLRVTPAQGGGSTVRASGDPEQAARVISVLDSRLAG